MIASSPNLGVPPSAQRAINELDTRLSRLENNAQAMAAAVVENFIVTPAPALDGGQISFDLVNTTGVLAVSILRAFSLDPGAAAVLASYPANSLAPGRTVTYSDNDPALAGQKANYWLRVQPANPALDATMVGPQSLDAAAADKVPPDALIAFDASVSADTATSVEIGIAFQPPNETRFGSCRVYATGYNANPDPVVVAQFASSPGNFALQKTGETVTLSAVSVNRAGIAAAIGTALTKAVTLNAATAPCRVLDGTATGIASGVQIGFPASPEASVTQYRILRGPLGAGPGASGLIGTVAATGAGSYTYLDSGGLGGQFEWYVEAVNPTGTSAPSPAIVLQAITSSANLPANAPFNNMNNATVDSIDAGSSATVRIYGPGGVGSQWTRTTGYGAETMPSGSIAGLAYGTVYYILWNGSAYFATTSFATALGDNNIWAGTVTTVNSGGGGGTVGGGGNNGNQSNGRLDPKAEL